MTRHDFLTFLDRFLVERIPLTREAALADWEAATSGSREAYEKAAAIKKKLEALHADRQAFAFLREVRASGTIQDPLEKRQLEQLYRRFLANQYPDDLREQIISLGAAIEHRFANFRGSVGTQRVTDNEIEEVLRKSTDASTLREYYEASKQVGHEVQSDVVRLVKLRNEAARHLGYRDYFQLKLDLDEQEEAWLLALFDDLDRRSAPAFAAAKAVMDRALATRHRIAPADLMPWHYQNRFFQDAPSIGAIDTDTPFREASLEAVVGAFYRSIGLEADDIIRRSDLYEREGKNPHAFCVDIDREGDIRTLQNLRGNLYWADTFLHELGHGVYAKYVDRSLPWLLRTENHIFATEGVALLFGRLAWNVHWLIAMGLLPASERHWWESPLTERQRHQALVFSRWTQVVVRFEKALYANPDQDLNALWWSLVERFQELRRPPRPPGAADWAAKIHIALYPIYYHNYELGELYASQLHATICRELFQNEPSPRIVYTPHTGVGRFLRAKVFGPGACRHWRAFVRDSTGEELSPEAFARDSISGVGLIDR
ncbi:MAG: M2 family metallopeptidase [Planctomycetota bacterium]